MKASIRNFREASSQSPITVKLGSLSVKIHLTSFRISRVTPKTGTRQLKSAQPQFTLTY